MYRVWARTRYVLCVGEDRISIVFGREEKCIQILKK